MLASGDLTNFLASNPVSFIFSLVFTAHTTKRRGLASSECFISDPPAAVMSSTVTSAGSHSPVQSEILFQQSCRARWYMGAPNSTQMGLYTPLMNSMDTLLYISVENKLKCQSNDKRSAEVESTQTELVLQEQMSQVVSGGEGVNSFVDTLIVVTQNSITHYDTHSFAYPDIISARFSIFLKLK